MHNRRSSQGTVPYKTVAHESHVQQETTSAKSMSVQPLRPFGFIYNASVEFLQVVRGLAHAIDPRLADSDNDSSSDSDCDSECDIACDNNGTSNRSTESPTSKTPKKRMM